MGWTWVVVLKQDRMDVYREAQRLAQLQEPSDSFEDKQRDRQVQLWDVKLLQFSQNYKPKVRVVISDEQWTQTRILGGQKSHKPKQSRWMWMVCGKLDMYEVSVIYHAGHRRWGIENKAFNE